MQPGVPSQNNAPRQRLRMADPRLRRYVPTDLFESLQEATGDLVLLEPAIHVAAAHYAVTTYLPRLLINQLLVHRRASPWVEWLDGSLLFADLSGSTALAERLSALGREGTERVTDFLNDVFTSMITVIQRYGGDLIAFGGDALLVFFGDNDNTSIATLAATALQEALHGYVKEIPGIGSFPMHVHIGVESGRMAFVAAGNTDALHYSVLGSTVNGVAAAEALAGPNELVIGPVAAARLKNQFNGTRLESGAYLVHELAIPQRQPTQHALEPVATPAPVEHLTVLLDELDRLCAYLPDVLLNRIIADPLRPQIEAELRPVTVVFAQVVGLELLAEFLPATLAAPAIQAYVAGMQDVVELYGGVVNKLDLAEVGMKLVAIFGAPTAYEDHVERAARAALGMRSRLPNIRQLIISLLEPVLIDAGNPIHAQLHRIVANPDWLQQRIGINLGTTFAGNVGSPSRKEYTVMGDAVNVAARVMSVAPWGEILCSEAVAQVIDARVVCSDHGIVMVKGKAQPLQLFQIQHERDSSGLILPERGKLVGRAHELAWLQQQLEQVQQGTSRVVRIVGDAGVGKSHLTSAFLEAAQRQGLRIISAACFSYTASIPYAAWGEWLKAVCAISSGDDEGERTRKLSARLYAVEPGLEEWLPLLGDLVRLDIPETQLTRGLDAELRQARRFDLLERLLRTAAHEQPIITVFEDLHWADPVSLDLWQHMAQAVTDTPVLFLGMHRNIAALAELRDAAAVLELQELGTTESRTLAEMLGQEYALAPELTSQLAARAGGNPLFLDELLRAVAAHQHSQPGSAQLSFESLPDSLNGLLLSRIDRLDEVSRSVLRVASVIGQRIPFGVLQSIQPNDQKQLLRQLARLDSEELTTLERVEPERVHAFRHTLIQEVAYQSMLYARRRELHGRIGDYLERRYRDDLDDYYGLLAHHYRLSDRHEKAVHYLVIAGDAARENYANEEAIQYYCWALEALNNEADPRAWQIRDAMADTYEVTGRYDEALNQHAMIIAAPQVSIDLARRAHRKRGSIHEKQGLYPLALEELNQAMAMATAGTDAISPLAIPRTYADIGIVRQRLGEYDLAIEACEAGLRHLRQNDRTRWDALIEADLHSILGSTYGMRGDYPRAQYHFERSLSAREAANDLRGMTISHNNLGYLWQLQSDYERALTHYSVVEQLADKIHLRYMQVFANANAAFALISLARYAEAEARCQVALQISHEIHAKQTTAQILTTLGIGYYQQGRYQEALQVYQQAQAINHELGSPYDQANVATYIAHVYSATRRYQEARQLAQEVLERAEALQSQRLKAEGLNALTDALCGLQHYAEAQAHAYDAARLAEQLGSKHDQAIALRNLGTLAAQQGQPFEQDYQASMRVLATINHRFELARTWASYGQALVQSGNLSDGSAYLHQAAGTFETIGALGELERLRITGVS